METPKEWPSEISDSYDPIRRLGTGGFASVVLASRKGDESNTDIPKKVAIKVVGGSDGSGNEGSAVLYARREIEILQQIRHCGIAQLFHSWERVNEDDEREGKDAKGNSPTAGVLVLEYIRGPTVESLLKHGGALSTTFGRVVIAQVMDAIAYLHYRSVLHRDIKPDNIIVTGALSSDDSIWDNDESETVSDRDYKSPEEWKRLCFKYRAKIIDFGFARALTPGDMEDGPSTNSNPTLIRHPTKKDAGYHNVHQDELDRSQREQKKKKKISGIIFNGSFHSTGSINLDGSTHSIGSAASISHKMKRVMSTLGNRNYAAPEIVNKVRQFSAQDKKNERQKDPRDESSKTTKTISAFVADYGLLVDSYSMGHTIRYMMTGVQPGNSVQDAIKKQKRSGMAKKVLSKLGLKKKTSTDSKTKGPRKPVFRSHEDLPGQVALLIDELTELLPHRRVSIRKARRNSPWISDVLAFQKQTNVDAATVSLDQCSEEQLHSLTQTRYLPMATATPGSVVSTTAPTVTTSSSNEELQLDSTEGSNASSLDSNKITLMDDNNAIGLSVEDEALCF